MALVLTLAEGEDFYVRDERVIVEEIKSPTAFNLRRCADGALLQVVEGKSVEGFKDVFFSAGARGQATIARVAIEAPRSVPLLRGENYRRGKP
jgi:hypothetical protein